MSRFHKTRIVSGTLLNQIIRGEGDDCDQEITVTYDNSFTAGVRVDHEVPRLVATLRDQHGDVVLTLQDDDLDLHQDFLFDTRTDVYTMSIRRGALTSLVEADREEYVTRCGTRCPFCGSEELHTGRYSGGHDREVTQRVECLSCEATWTDVYMLVGLRDETRPQEEVTMLDSESSSGASEEE